MQTYTKIEKSLKKQQPLIQPISEIYSTLMPKRKFQHHGLNQMQSLSLIYQHLRAPLQKLKNKIQEEVKADGPTDEDAKQEHEQQYGEQEQGEVVEHQGEQEAEDDEDMGEQLQNVDDEQHQDQAEIEQGQELQNQQQMEGQEEMDQPGEEGEQQLQGQDELGQVNSEEDVGLYGQQIDQQDMQSYQNQSMNDDPQFGNFVLNKMPHLKPKGQQQQQDEYIQDNFDQFRQIQLQNQKVDQKSSVPETELQKQIQNLQQRSLKSKNWVLGGQIKAKQRPVNSLVDTQLQFKSGIKFTHEITQNYNTSLQAIIKQRILDQIFDDRVRNIPSNFSLGKNKLENVSTEKSSKGLAELYEIQFKNSLGLADDKNQKVKKQIMDSLKQINYYLDTLSNTGFALKPSAKIQKDGSQAIVLQDKVPLTNWNGTIEQQNKWKKTFESDKEVNKKTLRLRNKRNARQRKKQQDKKRMNRSIEYGGMTKIQAQARKKIAKSKQNTKSVKYSKSSSFFNNMNDKNKPSKPNPNISKLKI